MDDQPDILDDIDQPPGHQQDQIDAQAEADIRQAKTPAHAASIDKAKQAAQRNAQARRTARLKANPAHKLQEPQAEHFCQLIAVKGLNQSEAYKRAYSRTASPRTAGSRGSVLAKRPDIAGRLLFLSNQSPAGKKNPPPIDGPEMQTDELLKQLEGIIRSPDSTNAERISAIKDYSERTGKGRIAQTNAIMPPDQLAEYEAARLEAIRRELKHAGHFARVHITTRDGVHELDAADLADLRGQIDALWDNSPPENSESAQVDDMQLDAPENLQQAKT